MAHFTQPGPGLEQHNAMAMLFFRTRRLDDFLEEMDSANLDDEQDDDVAYAAGTARGHML